jgi:replicative DNA helicase
MTPLPLSNAIKKILENKGRADKGLSNTLNWNFPSFEKYLPGIEREKFYCITANTSVGKSKLAKFMFIFSPFERWRKHRNEKVNILYYSLEESKTYFILNAISFYLFVVHGVKKSSKELLSLTSPLDDRIIDLIKDISPIIEELLSVVTVVDDLRRPSEIFDHATKNLIEDENAYNIIIVDHLSLLDTDRDTPTVRDAMIKFTSKYALYLRDKKQCSICVVQQQAAEQESLDHFMEKKLEPSLNGLGDAKVCGRDYNVVLGLFAPARHSIPKYRGYDVLKLGDSYRSLIILKDREGEANIFDHLYFDGRVNYFAELPKANELNYSIL